MSGAYGTSGFGPKTFGFACLVAGVYSLGFAGSGLMHVFFLGLGLGFSSVGNLVRYLQSEQVQRSHL